MCYRNRYSNGWSFIHSAFTDILWHIERAIYYNIKEIDILHKNSE